MSKHIVKDVLFIFVLFFSSLLVGQNNNSSRALSQINSSLAGQNMRIDSLDAQMRLLLPELQNALSANLDSPNGIWYKAKTSHSLQSFSLENSLREKERKSIPVLFFGPT